MRYRRIGWIPALALLFALCSCQSRALLGDDLSRDLIQNVVIEYLHEDRGDRILTTRQATEDASSFLDALLGAPQSDAPDVDWYSPTYSATHRIELSGAGESTTLYYDMGTGLLAWPQYEASKKEDEPPLLSYRFYKPDGLDEQIADQKQYAVIPFAAEGATPRHLDVYLRMSIVPADLAQEGTMIDYDLAEPPAYDEEEPFYRVIANGEREDMEVPKGEYLVVAAMGRKETSGYSLVIDRIEVNEHYTKIYINQETPAEGENVEPTPSSPIDAVLVEQKMLSTKKIIVFLDVNTEEILDLQKLSG